MIDLQEEIVKLRKEIFNMMEISNSEGLASTSDLVKANQAYVLGVTNLTEMKKNRSKLLHQLGIPSHIKGYQYLRDSILILYHKPELIGGITKELYPEIAIKYDTTVSRVERAIRHAIEVSCNRANCDVIQEYF